MALKDKLKHFRDFDDYIGSLTKKDMDDNLDLLADNIDLKPDKDTVGIVTDGITLRQQNNETQMAIGDGCTLDGSYGFIFGGDCTINNGYSFVFGFGIRNKQVFSKSFGVNIDGIVKQNLKHFNSLRTTNEDQIEFSVPIFLWIKSLNYIIIKCEAIKDDYSTKWIFERKIIVRVDADGNVTIDSDDNTDIIKDDSDWKFDIESTNDSENPTLTLKATGKANTNIAWGIEVENRQTYFAE